MLQSLKVLFQHWTPKTLNRFVHTMYSRTHRG